MIRYVLIAIFFSVILSIVINMILEEQRYNKRIEYDMMNNYDQCLNTQTMKKIIEMDRRIEMLENEDCDKRIHVLEILHNEELSRITIDNGVTTKQCAVREKTPYYLWNNETREMRNIAEVWLEDDE